MIKKTLTNKKKLPFIIIIKKAFDFVIFISLL